MSLLVHGKAATAAHQTAERPRLDGLDVLRGAAVGAVLLGHSWPGIFQGAGIVGVIVFFVLSGYLITGVLARDIQRHRKVRYGRFYAHRAFRLLPALILFLGVYAVVELAADVLGDRSKGQIGYTLLAGFGYLKDLPLPFDVSLAIGPLWTLAVEEQFYLVWPALLALALRSNRQGRLIGWSAAVVLSLMTASVLGMLLFAPQLHSLVYALPTTWGLGLIIGSALRSIGCMCSAGSPAAGSGLAPFWARSLSWRGWPFSLRPTSHPRSSFLEVRLPCSRGHPGGTGRLP
ncbi:putative peptidoglycan O-acetyltransferase YrhL [Arthrobacter sp. Hiyo6]|nr:putative peptidoglycan O-acetyltransferase YrhL [Arthrobacter sp. Hiyo6]